MGGYLTEDGEVSIGLVICDYLSHREIVFRWWHIITNVCAGIDDNRSLTNKNVGFMYIQVNLKRVEYFIQIIGAQEETIFQKRARIHQVPTVATGILIL